MVKIIYNKTSFIYQGRVKKIFINSFENSGSIDSIEIGKNLSSNKKISINKEGIIDSIYLYDDEELKLKTIIKVEKNSEIKEIMYSNSNGKIQQTIIHLHKQKNEFEFVLLGATNKIREQGVKYTHKNGLVLKEQSKVSDNYGTYKNYVTDYKYDDQNRLINKVRIREKTDLIYNISYKYLASDKNGNWTKRLIIHKNEENIVVYSSFEISEYEYY